MTEAVERAAGELYGAPLDEFVPRRDALAKELRSAGDRDGADAVKRLAKPSLAAWTVNRLARERPSDMAALIESGDELRRVQEWLLRREADPHDLRRAVESERAIVGRLAGAASEVLQAAGRRGGPALLERIAETLHAAAADSELGRRALAGRLNRDEVAVGLGVPGLQIPDMRPRPGAPPEPQPEPERDEAAIAEAESAAREATERQREAQRQLQRSQHAVVSAEAQFNDAELSLRNARRELADAERAAARARAAADAAAAELDELRDDRT